MKISASLVLACCVAIGWPVAVIAETLGTLESDPLVGRTQMKAQFHRPTSVPFPEDNPYTSVKADLGKKLFFDPRLSGSNSISCASCHNPAFSFGDGLAKGVGHGSKPLGRRTPTIWNLAWADLLMWDGRFETLEEQALGPMAAAVEMNQPMDGLVAELEAIPGYQALFSIAFPTEGITIDTIAKAIATYERTVVSGVTPFDKWVAGDEAAISDDAKKGFDLFNGKAKCAACHSTWNFTDGSFHDIGLPDDDLGRGNEFRNTVLMQHAFKTPTLRNIEHRAPYMHDGSLRSLASVVRHYNEGGIKRPSRSRDVGDLGLSQSEEDQIVAFMLTLTSDDDPVTVPRLPN